MLRESLDEFFAEMLARIRSIETLESQRLAPALLNTHFAQYACSRSAPAHIDPGRTPIRGKIMLFFVIVERDDGFEIVEVLPGQSPDDAAVAAGGKLADPGPYYSLEEANDALDQLEFFDEPP